MHCGFGAHFQNGRAEKQIRDLREIARKLLIHGMARWPHAITVNLWPYALRTANDQMNLIQIDLQGKSRIEKFSQVQVAARLKDFHTWGCPVFVLDGRLQSDPGGVPKWEPRS